MIKWKSIVSFLFLIIALFIINHPLFGQQRVIPKIGLKKLQLMPGLHIPQPADSAPKAVPLSSPMGTTKPMAKLSHQKVSQYFEQATQAMNLASSTPDFMNAFTISPSNPVVPGKGFILGICGAKSVGMSESGPGYVQYNQPGDDHHFVQFGFHAKKGFYLLNCDVMGIGGDYNAYIQAGSQNLTVSGTSDPQTAIIAFPVYVPQDCNVYITFNSPMNHWLWNGCEIIPQS